MDIKTQKIARARIAGRIALSDFDSLTGVLEYGFHSEDYVGVSRNGVVLFPTKFQTVSDGKLGGLMSYAAFYLYGLNLFNTEGSAVDAHTLFEKLNAVPFFDSTESPELRILEIPGELSYTAKKHAVNSAIAKLESAAAFGAARDSLISYLREFVLKENLAEDEFAFRNENFQLNKLSRLDKVNLLQGIYRGVSLEEEDYTVHMEFLKRNIEDFWDSGLFDLILSRAAGQARKYSKIISVPKEFREFMKEFSEYLGAPERETLA